MMLAELNTRLQPIQAPKTVVVLSAGLPFEQESTSYFEELQKRTAESGTLTHVVQFHQPETTPAVNGGHAVCRRAICMRGCRISPE